jgi:hypothetical protein
LCHIKKKCFERCLSNIIGQEQSFAHASCAAFENAGVAQNAPKSCHFVPLFLAKLILHLAWQWPKTSARPVSPFGMIEKEDTVHGVVDARRGSSSSFAARKATMIDCAVFVPASSQEAGVPPPLDHRIRDWRGSDRAGLLALCGTEPRHLDAAVRERASG